MLLFFTNFNNPKLKRFPFSAKSPLPFSTVCADFAENDRLCRILTINDKAILTAFRT